MKRFIFSLVAAAAVLASVMMAGAAPARAAAPLPANGSGAGHAAAPRVVNVRDLPAAPPPAAQANTALGNPGHPPTAGASLPSKPTTGHRPLAPGGQSANVSPRLASGTVSGFSGINDNLGGFCSFCSEANTSAAVSSTQIMQVAGLGFQVLNKPTLTTCSNFRSVASLLNSGTAPIYQPQVQYDNLQRRFILTAIEATFNAGTAPAIWVAASMSNDACGAWFVYRITFSGPAWPTTSDIIGLVPGQDSNALLFGVDNFIPSFQSFSVFGIAKSQLYFGSPVSFSTLATASFAAPATNAGFPMISTPFSYFVSAIPGTGYQLYRLTNSGGPGATVTLQAAISSPYSGPKRLVNQPGTTVGIAPASGVLLTSPVTDGTRIWFAHNADVSGFPTVQFGAITIATNTVATALAYHSGTSDDFNPSIGVGIGSGGAETIFLNWAYTDAPAGVATSDTVDSYVTTSGQVLSQIDTDVPVVHGDVTTTFGINFSYLSSVGIDPSVLDGSCAVAAQQFYTFGDWNTEISRIGNC